MTPAATQASAPHPAPGPCKVSAAAAPALAPSLEATKAAGLVDKLIDKLLHNKDETKEFLLPLADGRIIDTKGWNGPFIKQCFHHRMAEGGTTKNINTMAPFLAPASVYGRDPQPQYRQWLEEWAKWAMHRLPKTHEGGFQHMTYLDHHDGQLWDDTLVMTVLPLAKIGLVLNRPHYVDEAK